MSYGRFVPTITSVTADTPLQPDYEAPDTLVVSEPGQLRALADDVRTAVIALLRERAFSIQQLSEKLAMPKGTVGYHVKVLEAAGLIRVVRTRRVRAVTEKFYGRTARLFLFHTENPEDARAIGSAVLRRAAEELDRTPQTVTFGFPKARLVPSDARRFERRTKRLLDDFIAAETPEGAPYSFVAAIYERPDA
jgi:DNA-binding transcriptional ArsR family regulator